MTESNIRKVFSALKWPPTAGAFQKLIDFISESLSTKSDSKTVSNLVDKVSELETKIGQLETNLNSKADASTVTTLEETVGNKANQSDLESLSSRVTALESAQS